MSGRNGQRPVLGSRLLEKTHLQRTPHCTTTDASEVVGDPDFAFIDAGDAFLDCLLGPCQPRDSEFLANLAARQRLAAFFEARFGKIAILESLEIAFDELAGMEALGAAGALREIVQPPFNFWVQTDG